MTTFRKLLLKKKKKTMKFFYHWTNILNSDIMKEYDFQKKQKRMAMITMNHEHIFFLDNSQSAYFLGSLTTQKTFYLNKTAQELFGMTVETCDYTKIFDRTNIHIEEIIQQSLKNEKATLIYDMLIRTKDDNKILVDLQLGYFNQEKDTVYLELIPQKTSLEHLTIHQVNHSLRAEAVVNMDENLSFHFCNPNFYRIFEANKPSDLEHYNNQLIGTFAEENALTGKKIFEGLASSGTYFAEVEIITLHGNKKWYALDFQKRIFHGGQEKILCYATDIDEKVRKVQEISLLNRYLSVVQKSTVDILYRVDVETNTIYHFSEFMSEHMNKNNISDYVNDFMDKNTIHPDDQELYLENFKNFYENDVLSDTPVRFSLAGRDYQWYTITAEKIYDEQGKLTDVFGALVNVNQQQELVEQFEEVNQYFTVMQELTEDILYRVNLETMTMYHLVNFDMFGLEEPTVPDFVNTFINKKLVHPDDAEKYRKFDKDWAEGLADFCKLRLIHDGNYEWYKVERKKIYNEQGKITEILGKMSNIQEEQTKVQELSTLNQFFYAMQKMDEDVVYRVDVASMTLYLYKNLPDCSLEPRVIPDYFNHFKKNQIVHPEDREKYINMVEQWFAGTIAEEDFQCSARFALVTEDYVWYDIKGKKIYDSHGNFTEIYGKLININKERNLESNYSQVNQYFSAMQELTNDKLFHINLQTKTFIHNNSNTLNYGIPLEISNFPETVIQEKIVHPDCVDQFQNDVRKLLSGEKMEYKVLALADKDTYQWFLIKGRYIFNEKGEAIEVFGKMKNIQSQIDLENKATHDQLTKVLQKVTFAEEVSKILEESPNNAHHALAIIDMDDFKSVNDNYGHQFGDFVLESFAQRIKNCIRDTDLIGRLGGDEFLVFLKGVFNGDMALNRVETMLERLIPPFSNGLYTHRLGASIGVAIIPAEGISYEDLYKNADKAVYISKNKGKNTATLYTPDLEANHLQS